MRDIQKVWVVLKLWQTAQQQVLAGWSLEACWASGKLLALPPTS